MARPNRRQHRPPTTISYYGWDSLGDVHSTLTQLEQGQFHQAALMFDAMARDDRFSAVMTTRLLAPQTLKLDLTPPPAAVENAKAVELAEKMGGTEDGPGLWDTIYPAEELAELRYWGIGIGIGIGQQVWRTDDDGFWLPRLRVWHPQHLRWDEHLQRYVLRQYLGPDIVLPNVHENPRSDGQWILYCPYGYNEAWRKMSIVRGVAETVLDRKWNRIDWSRYNEKYGKPIEKVKVPQGFPQEKKDELFDNVASRHGETVMLCEQGVDNEGKPIGVDYELAESKSTGWDTFEARKKENDGDLAIRVLGQNSTTEVSEGKGSMALPGAELIRHDILVADTGMAVPLTYQGLTWIAEMNGVDPKLAPIAKYRTDPPEDKVAASTAKAQTVSALAAAKTAGIMLIDERAEMEDAGINVVSEEEQVVREAEAAERAAEIAGAMGGPGAGFEDDEEETDDEKPPAKKTAALAARRPPKVVKRYKFQGLDIAVENERGSTREWPGGSTRMQHDYGFIDNGQIGWDDDEVDVYIGPTEKASKVYVVHQLAIPTYDRYDEDKVMMGFDSYDAAEKAYVAHRNDGDRAIKSISVMPVAEFHRRLAKRKGQGPIRASVRARTNVALQALAKRIGRDVVALRAKPGGPAHADRLVMKGAARAAAALAGDLVAVKQEIANATDYKDLEARLLRRFKDMDPARLATIIERVRIMANLSGQLSARKEVKAP